MAMERKIKYRSFRGIKLGPFGARETTGSLLVKLFERIRKPINRLNFNHLISDSRVSVLHGQMKFKEGEQLCPICNPKFRPVTSFVHEFVKNRPHEVLYYRGDGMTTFYID